MYLFIGIWLGSFILSTILLLLEYKYVIVKKYPHLNNTVGDFLETSGIFVLFGFLFGPIFMLLYILIVFGMTISFLIWNKIKDIKI